MRCVQSVPPEMLPKFGGALPREPVPARGALPLEIGTRDVIYGMPQIELVLFRRLRQSHLLPSSELPENPSVVVPMMILANCRRGC